MPRNRQCPTSSQSRASSYAWQQWDVNKGDIHELPQQIMRTKSYCYDFEENGQIVFYVPKQTRYKV